MTTGAITDAIVTREPAPPTITEGEAVAAILEGHRAGAYSLPAPLIAAAEGAAAVMARDAAVHNELSVAETALSEGAGRLVAEIVRASATAGAIPKIDAGAEMVRLEAAVARLRHEAAVFFRASERIAAYPVTIVRAIAPDVHAALDAGLRELLKAALPHAAKLAAVDPDAPDPLVKAYRADPAGYDVLEALLPRYEALEAAGAALAALRAPWLGLDGAPTVREPVLRLAQLAEAAR